MGYAADKTLLDKTIEMLKTLNDQQLSEVHSMLTALVPDDDDDGFFRPLTEEEFFKRVDEGLDDIKHGRYEEIAAAEKKLREEFGL